MLLRDKSSLEAACFRLHCIDPVVQWSIQLGYFKGRFTALSVSAAFWIDNRFLIRQTFLYFIIYFYRNHVHNQHFFFKRSTGEYRGVQGSTGECRGVNIMFSYDGKWKKKNLKKKFVQIGPILSEIWQKKERILRAHGPIIIKTIRLRTQPE